MNRKKCGILSFPLQLSIFGVFVCILTTGCSNLRLSGIQPPAEAENEHLLVLTTPNEAGQSLILTGTVTDSQTGKPLAGVKLYLYQADAKGEYSPSNLEDESTARLSGEVITGEAGQFTVHTIVPREYDLPGNRHIHLHYVRANGYQEIGRVILFENDVNDEIRQWAIETGFGIIIELDEIDGIMHGNVTISLDPAD